jgi:hypothetical protein
MQARERILLTVLGLVVAATAWLLLRGPTEEPLAPPVPEATETGATSTTAPPTPEAPAAASGDVLDGPAVATPRQIQQDTSGWTTGVIRGDVSLAVNAIDKIQSLMVVVEEQRVRTGPDGSERKIHSQVVPIEFDRRSTPTFEVRNVPFSEYPYLVTLYSPGLNGSRRTVVVDAEHPLVEDVVLQLTVAGPLTLLLRDQDGLPYPQYDVRLSPVGDPLGRPRLDATSDSYGSAMFESVLGGDYQALVMQGGQQIGPPHAITVIPDARLYQTQIQGQGQTLTIPRGVPLEVRVVDARGYGIQGAKVKVQATDRTRLTEMELPSDTIGAAKFPHLVPGTWQIDVFLDGYQPRSRQITIKDREPIDPVQINLVRLR